MELLQPESPDSGVICRLGAILEMDPVEDAVHVILDRPDGDEELIGNLLITGPLAERLQHLRLAPGELGLASRLRLLGRLSDEYLQDALGHLGVDDGFAVEGIFKPLEQLVRPHVLEEITVGAASG